MLNEAVEFNSIVKSRWKKHVYRAMGTIFKGV